MDELYDLRAVRVAVDDVAACYAALGVVHALWLPMPSEFDDYIARPKPNDYRSLHTAVIGPEGRTLEVQIRTHEMHAQAELGVAAHWRYKEGKGGEGKGASKAFDRKIAWMRQLLEQSGGRRTRRGRRPGRRAGCTARRRTHLHPDAEGRSHRPAARRHRARLRLSRAHHGRASHPRGQGQRPHRAVEPCAAQWRPRRNHDREDRRAAARLAAGRPMASWPADVRATRCARGSTNSTARATCRPDARCWRRELKRLGLHHADLAPMARKFHADSIDDLYIQVALGDVGPHQIGRALHEELRARLRSRRRRHRRCACRDAPPAPPKSKFTVQGVGNLLVQLARCCQPVPGRADRRLPDPRPRRHRASRRLRGAAAAGGQPARSACCRWSGAWPAVATRWTCRSGRWTARGC